MLSAHEFATLMLICQLPEQVDMNRAELGALLRRQLVMLECSTGGHRRHARLTDTERSILRALNAIDRQKHVTPGSACRDTD